VHLDDAAAERAVETLMARAAQHPARLLFVLATGGGQEATERCAALSGTREGLCVVCLPDAEIARLLEERGNLDRLLRNRVREARMRRI